MFSQRTPFLSCEVAKWFSVVELASGIFGREGQHLVLIFELFYIRLSLLFVQPENIEFSLPPLRYSSLIFWLLTVQDTNPKHSPTIHNNQL